MFSRLAGVATAASPTVWLLVMLLTVQLLSPYPAAVKAILTIAVFPALSVPSAAAHRSVANPDRA